MVRNIFITNDNRDNISIFEKEPVYLVNFKREDFSKLGNLEEAKKPGIYLLIGENRRYVGQASSSVISRLNSHEKAKDFWTSCIFFGRNDGLIDKSQLDYLEKYYIKQFQEAGFEMDNDRAGNSSKIQKLNKIKADEIRDIFEEILVDVANISLFDHLESQEEFSQDEVYVKVNGKIFKDKSPRQVQIKFVQHLLRSNEYGKQLRDKIVDEKATFKNNLGTKQNIFPSGAKAAVEIKPGIFLWVNSSKIQTSASIDKIANWLGIKEKIEKNF